MLAVGARARRIWSQQGTQGAVWRPHFLDDWANRKARVTRSLASRYSELKALRSRRMILFYFSQGRLGHPDDVSGLPGWQGPRRWSCAFDCVELPGKIAYSPALPCPWIRSCYVPSFSPGLDFADGEGVDKVSGSSSLFLCSFRPQHISPFPIVSLSSV